MLKAVVYTKSKESEKVVVDLDNSSEERLGIVTTFRGISWRRRGSSFFSIFSLSQEPIWLPVGSIDDKGSGVLGVFNSEINEHVEQMNKALRRR
jgi:hypothetical protein